MSVEVDSNTMPKMRIFKYGLNDELKGMSLDTVFPIESNRINYFSLLIPQKGVYGIQDATISSINHKLFLRPGDSLKLTFIDLSESDRKLKGERYIITRHKMIVNAKYPGNLIFFDSISLNLPLKYGKIKNESLKQYRIRCDSIYQVWLGILKRMVQQKKVSLDFVDYAKAAISSKYLTWLAGPAAILPRKAFPSYYFKLPDSLNFNQSKYIHTLPDYAQAAFLKNKYFNIDDKNKKGYSQLKKQFLDIIRHNSGIVRDQLMAIKLREYAPKNDAYFDTAYTLFLQSCSNPSIKQTVKNAVTASILHITGDNEPIKWRNVPIHTALYNAEGQLTTLKQITKDTSKLYLIDCWATWCAPCRVQIPYIKDIARKYKNRLKVISISFDLQSKAWRSFLKNKKNELTKFQYRVYDPRKSALIEFLKVRAIPRYILLSRGGKKVLEENMTIPSLRNRFEDQLKIYLMK